MKNPVNVEMPGVVIKPVAMHSDARGWLMECFRIRHENDVESPFKIFEV